MSERVVIAIDAVGGDFGPQPVLDGVEQALAQDENIEIIIVGPADVVEPFAANHDCCTAQVATEKIEMHEHPAEAVRRKKDSSIVVGCQLVKEGKAQGFFSPGSTGAIFTAATLVVGRIKGVSRPALCTVIPSPYKPVVMCDVGANADCKPEYLLQFGQMATAYTENVIGVANPKAYLLNIGSEDTKGSKFAQDCFALLKEKLPNFVGNAEGTDVLAGGEPDIYITDGFTGNVCLKTIEGVSKTLFTEIKKIMMASASTKLAAVALKGGLEDLKESINPDAYGGAPVLGVKGTVLIGHGNSNATAIMNGIFVAAKTIRADVPGVIAQTVSASKEEK